MRIELNSWRDDPRKMSSAAGLSGFWTVNRMIFKEGLVRSDIMSAMVRKEVKHAHTTGRIRRRA